MKNDTLFRMRLANLEVEIQNIKHCLQNDNQTNLKTSLKFAAIDLREMAKMVGMDVSLLNN